MIENDFTCYDLVSCGLAQGSEYTCEGQKLQNQGAIGSVLAHTLVSQSTSGTDTIPLRDRYVCARSRRTRSHPFAFHARDPIRTTTVKAHRCQHVCQRNERNPSTCEIGRATPRPRSDRETLPERSPGRDVRASTSSVKSVKRRLRNDVI